MNYHDYAETAHRVAECAHSQGRFDAMRTLLFENQQRFGSIEWVDLAMQAGIEELSQFDDCVNAPDAYDSIEQSQIVADRLGIHGTPTIFVNGWKLPLAPSTDVFDRMVKNVVEGRPPAAEIDFQATIAQN